MVDPRMGRSNLVIHGYSVRGARGYCVHPWPLIHGWDIVTWSWGYCVHPWLIHGWIRGYSVGTVSIHQMGYSKLDIHMQILCQGSKGVLRILYMVDLWMDVLAR